jgi:fructosamine-3-kinase
MLKDILKGDIKNYINDYNLKDKLNIKENFKVEFLAQGEYNINFIIDDDVKKHVFRVNTKSQLEIENQIKYEFDALKSLEISNVTPKAYYLDDTKNYFDYGILIMEFLYGRPLEYNKDMIKAGKIFGNIHSLDLSKIDTNNFIVENNILSDRIKEGNRWLKNFFKSDLVDYELKDLFYRFIDYCEKNKYKEKYFIENKWHVINNTEVNSHNFIIGDNSYLIDWEKPVISDPCQDITQFLAITTTLWKQNYILSDYEINEFYKSYLENINEDKDIKERVNIYSPYLYLRALSWCAGAYLEYKDPNKEIKNVDTYNKIKEYLDVNFMKKILKPYIG